MSKNKVIIQFNDVRIVTYNAMNVEIQTYQKIVNTTEKTTYHDWRFIGYQSTIAAALRSIIKQELLINYDEVNGLTDYLEKVEASNDKMLKAINELKGGWKK